MPKRLQRRRTKGYRLPVDAVYVGRPTRFGNPWAVGEAGIWHDRPMSALDAVEAFAYGLNGDPLGLTAELRGRDLACWCPLDQPCHADVLLELANA